MDLEKESKKLGWEKVGKEKQEKAKNIYKECFKER